MPATRDQHADGAPGDAIGRWAAVQAGTILAGGRQELPTAVPRPVPVPAPTVLASFTETRSWPTEGGRVESAALVPSPDGQSLLATGGGDGIARIWNPDTGELVHTVIGSSSRVWSVVWGDQPAGGPLLATGGQDGFVRIWNPDTGELVRSLAPSSVIQQISWGYRYDGRPLLAAGGGNAVRIWNPESGELLHTLTGHPDSVFSVAFGHWPERQPLLVVGGAGGFAQIWNPETGELLHTLTGHTGTVVSIAFAYRSNGDPLIATAGHDRTARIWAPESGGFTSHVLPLDDSLVYTVSWAPIDDGRLLLAATTEYGVHLCDGNTMRRLEGRSLSFRTSGYDHSDWTLTPAGRLLFAAAAHDNQVHVWDVVLDPPVPPPVHPAAPTAQRERAATPAASPVTILDPPEDVTPDFPDSEEARQPIRRLSCAVGADGHVLLAATVAWTGLENPNGVQIWDLSAGIMLRTLAQATGVMCAAWGTGVGGQPLLATGSTDGRARIWDPGTGELVHTLTGHTATVEWVAWRNRSDGQPLLATGGADRTARIWAADTGERLRTVTEHTRTVENVAWGNQSDGQPLLATASDDGIVRIWDPDTGGLLRTLAGHGGYAWFVAWGYRPDGQPLLASTGDDGAVRIWDPDTGETVRTIAITRQSNVFYSLDWVRLPDGRQLLAGASGDRTARIWDPDTGAELASVPGSSTNRGAIALVRDPAGSLLMVVANNYAGGGPARVWRIATGLGQPAAPPPDPTARTASRPTAELAGWLLRLGRAGLWPPLGLMADLIELTGPGGARLADGEAQAGGALCDTRLAALADEPGIARLRQLGWETKARVSFAALLASGLTIPERYSPPPGASAQALRDALTGAVPERNAPPRAASIPLTDLRAAAAQVTDRAITLLRILGPGVCAADPLLPARLAHRIPPLPELSPRELRLLTAGGGGRPGTDRDSVTGTLLYSPGTAGLARTGPLTRLLPTQLALPRDLLIIRLAEGQLLYRQHRAPAPPAPEPVTIILDTTPPTYGPAGNALRLAAHLITTTLWEHDRYPHLISLADPGTVIELRTPADLIAIWASAALDDPAAALATALTAAADIEQGRPTLFATHFQTARSSRYQPGPAARLLTAHQPPEPPPPPAAGRWHQHLPPSPTQAQLTLAIGRLLDGGNADEN